MLFIDFAENIEKKGDGYVSTFILLVLAIFRAGTQNL